MSHSFTVQIRDEISSVLKKIESEIISSGGSFQGNSENGSFDVKSLLGIIKGKYSCISDNEIRITIKEKPFIIGYGIIESEVKEYFS
ncbi:MAG: hypothetical protein H6R43_613 [Nitrospirae bacterium]|jgi:hypothetical protein|nr:hypothetical protein [Nitrospirota bacterium]